MPVSRFSKRGLILISGILLLAACAGIRNREIVRSCVIRQGVSSQAFLDVWGSPTRTKVINQKEAQETLSVGWNRFGGGLFKGRRSSSFQLWEYEDMGIQLLFDGSNLVDWKTDRTVQELCAAAEKRKKEEAPPNVMNPQ